MANEQLDFNEITHEFDKGPDLEFIPIQAQAQDLDLPKVVTPKNFERLCCQIIEQKEKCIAKIYKNEGSKQDGIDIVVPPNLIDRDKYHTYQCKRWKTVSPSKIDKFIKDFKIGRWYNKSKKFVLCISCKLNDNTTNRLYYFQEELLKEGIEFDWWLSDDINKHLRVLPDIVITFFGKIFAERFCSRDTYNARKFPDKIRYPAQPNYIERSLSASNHSESLSFVETISRDQSIGNPVRYILLNSAAFGKSTELKQLASHFSNDEEVLFPIFIQFRDCYTNQEIDELLFLECIDWQNVPQNQVLTILDGLDEIDSSEYYYAVRKINVFAKKYPKINIILSSRSNFYSVNDEGAHHLVDFSIVHLQNLTDSRINRYIENTLETKTNKFLNQLSNLKNIKGLLVNPFFLVSIVRLFISSNYKDIPQSIEDLFEKLIEKKIKNDEFKFPELEDNRKRIRHCVEFLALSFVALGKSRLSIDELQELVPDKSLSFLKKSFLLEKLNQGWQFEHNSFQEYLASGYFKNKELKEIKKWTSFAPDHLELKSKWINTLGHIFSSNHNNGNEILEWLMEIKPEILLQFEYENMPILVREWIFKSILQENFEKGIYIRSEYISHEKIIKFSGESENIFEFLLEELTQVTATENKIDILVLLFYSDLAIKYKLKILKTIKTILSDEQVCKDVKTSAIDLLRKLELNSTELNEILLLIPKKDLGTHKIRRGIYILINESRTIIVDNYMDFYLEGLEIYKEEKIRSIIHYITDERVIFKGLAMARSPENSLKIVIQIKEDLTESGGYNFNPNNPESKEFLTSIFKQAEVNIDEEPTIFDHVLEFLYKVQKNYNDDYLEIFTVFFANDDTIIRAFNEYQKFWTTDRFRKFLPIANRTCIDYFIEQYKIGVYNKNNARQFANNLHFASNSNQEYLVKELIKLDQEFGQMIKPDNQAKSSRWKERNDQLLGNEGLFKAEIKKIYQIIGKKVISFDDISRHELSGKVEFGSNHAIQFMRSQFFKKKKNEEKSQLGTGHIDIDSILLSINEIIGTKEDIELFFINQINGKVRNNIAISDDQFKYAQGWSNKRVKESNFKTTFIYREGQWLHYSNLIFLADFICRLRIDFPEDIMLDLISAQCNYYGGTPSEKQVDSPLDFILEKVGFEKVEKRILENLNGELSPRQFLTLIQFCGHHNIKKASHHLLKFLIDDESDFDHEKKQIFEYLVTFELELKIYEELLYNTRENQTFFWSIVKFLDDNHSDKVLSRMYNILNEYEIDSIHTTKACNYLVRHAEIKGLTTMLQLLDSQKRMPLEIAFSENDLLKLPNKNSLQLILQRIQIPYLEDYEGADDRMDTLSSTLNFWVSTYAMQNRELLDLTIDTINSKIIALENNNPRIKYLCYQLETFKKKYYLNKETDLKIGDLINLKPKWE